MEFENQMKEAAISMKRIICKTNSKNEDNCSICLDTLKNRTVNYLPCGHVFHSKCLESQFKTLHLSSLNCCMCRDDLYEYFSDYHDEKYYDTIKYICYEHVLEDEDGDEVDVDDNENTASETEDDEDDEEDNEFVMPVLDYEENEYVDNNESSVVRDIEPEIYPDTLYSSDSEDDMSRDNLNMLIDELLDTIERDHEEFIRRQSNNNEEENERIVDVLESLQQEDMNYITHIFDNL